MARREDWAERLSEYLSAHRAARFGYGAGLDCGVFAADVVAVLSGTDPAEDLRGSYSSRKTAFAAIRRLCGRASMEAAATTLAARYGFAETPVAFAQRGDVVQIDTGSKARLGIVAMHGTELLTPGKDGLLTLPRAKAVRAWRIA
jgi:hypothetical protein